jgi:hypothetical protein
MAGLLGGIVWVAFFTPPSVTESLDWENYYRANFHFLFQSLAGGEFPWWNPHIGLGRPFASDIQNAIWYPASYLLMLGETPGLFLLIWGHLLITSLGIQRLALAFGAEFRWAAPAGFVFAMSGCIGLRILSGQLFYVFGLSFLPWILLWVNRLTMSPDRRTVTWLVILHSLQFFSGHPQAAWITIVGTTGYLLLIAGDNWYTETTAKPWRPLVAYAATLGLTAVVTAIGWLPMLDLIANGNRAAGDLAYASFGKLEWLHVVGLFTRPPMDAPLSWEMNSHLGFAWTIPGLIGVFLLRDRRQRILLLLAFLLFCFCFGDQSIVFHLIYKLVPGAGSFRIPARMLIWPAMVIVVISAVVLSRTPAGRIPWPVVAGIAGALVLTLISHFPHPTADGNSLGITPPLLALIAATGGLCLVWVGNRNGNRATIAIIFLMGVTVAEFVAATRHYRQAYAVGVHTGTRIDPTSVDRVVAAVGNIGVDSSSPIPPRLNLPSRIVPANHGMIHGYCNVDAYTSLFLKRPWNALHILTDTPGYQFRNSGLSDVFFTNHPLAIPSVSVNLGIGPTVSGFLVNTNPLPRAWFSTASQSVSGFTSAIDLIRRGFPYQRCAIIESPTAGTPNLPPDARSLPVIPTSFSPSSIHLRVEAPVAGYLVVNEAWFPGWEASIAGQQLSVEPVNGWMRGVPLPAGIHEVQMRFRPRHWRWAITTTLFGICLLAVWNVSATVGSRFRAPDAVNRGTDDSTGIAGPFTARK